jgi:signal transduction histidine kinase
MPADRKHELIGPMRNEDDPFGHRLLALMAVAEVDPSQDLPTFCGEVTQKIGELCWVRKVLFGVLDGKGQLVLQPSSYGFDLDLVLPPTPCRPDGTGLADRVVFGDLVFHGSVTDDPAFNPYGEVLAAMQISNVVAVGVRAGNEPVGMLVACDSERSEGFTVEDTRILQITAAGAGLIWRQKQLSDERATLHREAQILNEGLQNMVSMMVHELRAPLTVARGYLDMLLEGTFGSVSVRATKPLELTAQKTAEAARLVDDMLLSARLDARSLPSNPERFDVVELVKRIASDAKPAADLVKARLELEAPAPVMAWADPRHITTTLDNLVRNALMYSSGTPRVRLAVSSDPQPTVRVIDNGRGIPPELHERIFERFYRVQDRSGPPGSGLGLYLSRQLAEAQGAELFLESSQVGAGSTFTLRLGSEAAA